MFMKRDIGELSCEARYLVTISSNSNHYLLNIEKFSSGVTYILPILFNMISMDQSNTNWSPFPRLANVPQRVQVVGGVATIMFGAFLMLQWRRSAGAKLPETMSKEWREAEEKLSYAKPTESGGDPVVINPITKAMRGQSPSKWFFGVACLRTGLKSYQPWFTRRPLQMANYLHFHVPTHSTSAVCYWDVSRWLAWRSLLESFKKLSGKIILHVSCFLATDTNLFVLSDFALL